MNKTTAIQQVLTEAERANEFISSSEVVKRSLQKIDEANALIQKMKSYDAALPLSEMKYPLSNYSVIRALKSNTIVEFLGEEFWLSLNSYKERDCAARVYKMIRERFER
jgi:hypothetical protein